MCEALGEPFIKEDLTAEDRQNILLNQVYDKDILTTLIKNCLFLGSDPENFYTRSAKEKAADTEFHKQLSAQVFDLIGQEISSRGLDEEDVSEIVCEYLNIINSYRLAKQQDSGEQKVETEGVMLAKRKIRGNLLIFARGCGITSEQLSAALGGRNAYYVEISELEELITKLLKAKFDNRGAVNGISGKPKPEHHFTDAPQNKDKLPQGQDQRRQRLENGVIHIGGPRTQGFDSQEVVVTEQEEQILILLDKGYIRKEIRVQLGIKESELKSVMQGLFRKFGVKSLAPYHRYKKLLSKAKERFSDLGIKGIPLSQDDINLLRLFGLGYLLSCEITSIWGLGKIWQRIERMTKRFGLVTENQGYVKVLELIEHLKKQGYLPHSFSKKGLSARVKFNLNKRDIEILRLVATGASNRDIVNSTGYTLTQVQWTLRDLYTKLGIEGNRGSRQMYRTRLVLCLKAKELGLLNPKVDLAYLKYLSTGDFLTAREKFTLKIIYLMISEGKIPHYMEVNKALGYEAKSGEYGKIISGIYRKLGVARGKNRLLRAVEQAILFKEIKGNIDCVFYGHKVLLTKRQLQILDLVSLGRNPKFISGELDLAVSTVRKHIGRLKNKFRIKKETRNNSAVYLALIKSGIKNGYVPERRLLWQKMPLSKEEYLILSCWAEGIRDEDKLTRQTGVNNGRLGALANSILLKLGVETIDEAVVFFGMFEQEIKLATIEGLKRVINGADFVNAAGLGVDLWHGRDGSKGGPWDKNFILEQGHRARKQELHKYALSNDKIQGALNIKDIVLLFILYERAEEYVVKKELLEETDFSNKAIERSLEKLLAYKIIEADKSNGKQWKYRLAAKSSNLLSRYFRKRIDSNTLLLKLGLKPIAATFDPASLKHTLGLTTRQYQRLNDLWGSYLAAEISLQEIIILISLWKSYRDERNDICSRWQKGPEGISARLGLPIFRINELIIKLKAGGLIYAERKTYYLAEGVESALNKYFSAKMSLEDLLGYLTEGYNTNKAVLVQGENRYKRFYKLTKELEDSGLRKKLGLTEREGRIFIAFALKFVGKDYDLVAGVSYRSARQTLAKFEGIGLVKGNTKKPTGYEITVYGKVIFQMIINSPSRDELEQVEPLVSRSIYTKNEVIAEFKARKELGLRNTASALPHSLCYAAKQHGIKLEKEVQYGTFQEVRDTRGRLVRIIPEEGCWRVGNSLNEDNIRRLMGIVIKEFLGGDANKVNRSILEEIFAKLGIRHLLDRANVAALLEISGYDFDLAKMRAFPKGYFNDIGNLVKVIVKRIAQVRGETDRACRRKDFKAGVLKVVSYTKFWAIAKPIVAEANQLYNQGLSPQEISDKLLKKYRVVMIDPDEPDKLRYVSAGSFINHRYFGVGRIVKITNGAEIPKLTVEFALFDEEKQFMPYPGVFSITGKAEFKKLSEDKDLKQLISDTVTLVMQRIPLSPYSTTKARGAIRTSVKDRLENKLKNSKVFKREFEMFYTRAAERGLTIEQFMHIIAWYVIKEQGPIAEEDFGQERNFPSVLRPRKRGIHGNKMGSFVTTTLLNTLFMFIFMGLPPMAGGGFTFGNRGGLVKYVNKLAFQLQTETKDVQFANRFREMLLSLLELKDEDNQPMVGAEELDKITRLFMEVWKTNAHTANLSIDGLPSYVRKCQNRKEFNTKINRNISVYLLEKAEAYVDRYRFAEALEYLDEALTFAPDNAQIYNDLGYIYIMLGLYAEAVEYFSKALESGEKSAETYLLLSKAYCYLGDYHSAEEFAQSSLLLGGERDEFFFSGLDILIQGFDYLVGGDLQEAVNYFSKENGLDTEMQKMADKYRHLIHILQEEAQGMRSRWEYLKIYQSRYSFDIKLARAFNYYGSALMKEGQLEEAINAFRYALELNPHLDEVAAGDSKKDLKIAIDKFDEANRNSSGFFDNIVGNLGERIGKLIDNKKVRVDKLITYAKGTLGKIDILVKIYCIEDEISRAPPLFVFARKKDDALEIYLSEEAYLLFTQKFTYRQQHLLFRAVAIHEYEEVIKGKSHLEAQAAHQEFLKARPKIQDKLDRYTEAEKGGIIIEETAHPLDWSAVFGNNNPVYIEIGFYTADNLIIQASKNPEINFVGIEQDAEHMKGLWGDILKAIRSKKLNNIRIIKGNAFELIPDMFEDSSVKRIYMLFPNIPDRIPELMRQSFKDIARKIDRGGRFSIYTEYKGVAIDIAEVLLNTQGFESLYSTAVTVVKNPMNINSPYAQMAAREHKEVYAVEFVKRQGEWQTGSYYSDAPISRTEHPFYQRKFDHPAYVQLREELEEINVEQLEKDELLLAEVRRKIELFLNDEAEFLAQFSYGEAKWNLRIVRDILKVIEMDFAQGADNGIISILKEDEAYLIKLITLPYLKPAVDRLLESRIPDDKQGLIKYLQAKIEKERIKFEQQLEYLEEAHGELRLKQRVGRFTNLARDHYGYIIRSGYQDSGHGWAYVRWSIGIAKIISKELQLTEEEKYLALIAIICEDYFRHTVGENHAGINAELIGPLLELVCDNDKQIELVKEAIKEHNLILPDKKDPKVVLVVRMANMFKHFSAVNIHKRTIFLMNQFRHKYQIEELNTALLHNDELLNEILKQTRSYWQERIEEEEKYFDSTEGLLLRKLFPRLEDEFSECRKFVRALNNENLSMDIILRYLLISFIPAVFQEHSYLVAEYSSLLAKALGLPKEICRLVRIVGLLHDSGKIRLPDLIIMNIFETLPDVLYELIKEHPGYSRFFSNWINMDQTSKNAMYYHHERLCGDGYPEGLKGEEIPYPARIVAVADCFAAMTEGRTYKRGMSFGKAFKALADLTVIQLDPYIVKVFLMLFKENTIPIMERGAPLESGEEYDETLRELDEALAQVEQKIKTTNFKRENPDLKEVIRRLLEEQDTVAMRMLLNQKFVDLKPYEPKNWQEWLEWLAYNGHESILLKLSTIDPFELKEFEELMNEALVLRTPELGERMMQNCSIDGNLNELASVMQLLFTNNIESMREVIRILRKEQSETVSRPKRKGGYLGKEKQPPNNHYHHNPHSSHVTGLDRLDADPNELTSVGWRDGGERLKDNNENKVVLSPFFFEPAAQGFFDTGRTISREGEFPVYSDGREEVLLKRAKEGRRSKTWSQVLMERLAYEFSYELEVRNFSPVQIYVEEGGRLISVVEVFPDAVEFGSLYSDPRLQSELSRTHPECRDIDIETGNFDYPAWLNILYDRQAFVEADLFRLFFNCHETIGHTNFLVRKQGAKWEARFIDFEHAFKIRFAHTSISRHLSRNKKYFIDYAADLIQRVCLLTDAKIEEIVERVFSQEVEKIVSSTYAVEDYEFAQLKKRLVFFIRNSRDRIRDNLAGRRESDSISNNPIKPRGWISDGLGCEPTAYLSGNKVTLEQIIEARNSLIAEGINPTQSMIADKVESMFGIRTSQAIISQLIRDDKGISRDVIFKTYYSQEDSSLPKDTEKEQSRRINKEFLINLMKEGNLSLLLSYANSQPEKTLNSILALQKDPRYFEACNNYLKSQPGATFLARLNKSLALLGKNLSVNKINDNLRAYKNCRRALEDFHRKEYRLARLRILEVLKLHPGMVVYQRILKEIIALSNSETVSKPIGTRGRAGPLQEREERKSKTFQSILKELNSLYDRRISLGKAGEIEEQNRVAREYERLKEEYGLEPLCGNLLRNKETGKVIVISGKSGSGKTFLSYLLSGQQDSKWEFLGDDQLLMKVVNTEGNMIVVVGHNFLFSPVSEFVSYCKINGKEEERAPVRLPAKQEFVIVDAIVNLKCEELQGFGALIGDSSEDLTWNGIPVITFDRQKKDVDSSYFSNIVGGLNKRFGVSQFIYEEGRGGPLQGVCSIPKVNEEGFEADYIIQYGNGKMFVFRHRLKEARNNMGRIYNVRDFTVYELTQEGQEVFVGALYYVLDPNDDNMALTSTVKYPSGDLFNKLRPFPFWVNGDYRRRYYLGTLLLYLASCYMRKDGVSTYDYCNPSIEVGEIIERVFPNSKEGVSLVDGNSLTLFQEIRSQAQNDLVLADFLEDGRAAPRNEGASGKAGGLLMADPEIPRRPVKLGDLVMDREVANARIAEVTGGGISEPLSDSLQEGDYRNDSQVGKEFLSSAELNSNFIEALCIDVAKRFTPHLEEKKVRQKAKRIVILYNKLDVIKHELLHVSSLIVLAVSSSIIMAILLPMPLILHILFPLYSIITGILISLVVQSMCEMAFKGLGEAIDNLSMRNKSRPYVKVIRNARVLLYYSSILLGLDVISLLYIYHGIPIAFPLIMISAVSASLVTSLFVPLLEKDINRAEGECYLKIALFRKKAFISPSKCRKSFIATIVHEFVHSLEYRNEIANLKHAIKYGTSSAVRIEGWTLASAVEILYLLEKGLIKSDSSSEEHEGWSICLEDFEKGIELVQLQSNSESSWREYIEECCMTQFMRRMSYSMVEPPQAYANGHLIAGKIYIENNGNWQGIWEALRAKEARRKFYIKQNEPNLGKGDGSNLSAAAPRSDLPYIQPDPSAEFIFRGASQEELEQINRDNGWLRVNENKNFVSGASIDTTISYAYYIYGSKVVIAIHTNPLIITHSHPYCARAGHYAKAYILTPIEVGKISRQQGISGTRFDLKENSETVSPAKRKQGLGGPLNEAGYANPVDASRPPLEKTHSNVESFEGSCDFVARRSTRSRSPPEQTKDDLSIIGRKYMVELRLKNRFDFEVPANKRFESYFFNGDSFDIWYFASRIFSDGMVTWEVRTGEFLIAQIEDGDALTIFGLGGCSACIFKCRKDNLSYIAALHIDPSRIFEGIAAAVEKIKGEGFTIEGIILNFNEGIMDNDLAFAKILIPALGSGNNIYRIARPESGIEDIIVTNKGAVFSINNKPQEPLLWSEIFKSSEVPIGDSSSLQSLEGFYEDEVESYLQDELRFSRMRKMGLYFPSSIQDAYKTFKSLGVDGSTKVVDLGSGDGRIVYTAALLGAQATGIEFDPILAGIGEPENGWIRKSLPDIVDFSRIRILQKDFLEEDLSQYDVIFYYYNSSSDDGQERLKEKLLREMHPDAKLVVYGSINQDHFSQLSRLNNDEFPDGIRVYTKEYPLEAVKQATEDDDIESIYIALYEKIISQEGLSLPQNTPAEVLDLGCGPFYYGAAHQHIFSRLAGQVNYTAVDKNSEAFKDALENAQQLGLENLEIRPQEMGGFLEANRGRFDVITLNHPDVFYPADVSDGMLLARINTNPEKIKLVNKIYAALKPQGVLIITLFDWEYNTNYSDLIYATLESSHFESLSELLHNPLDCEKFKHAIVARKEKSETVSEPIGTGGSS